MTEAAPAAETAFTITVRDVPEMIVAYEFAERHAHELPAWLPGAMSRVYQTADALGGVVRTDALDYLERGQFAPEPVFIVIYDGNPAHGAMRVDVTAPVSGVDAEAAAKNDALLHFPAHKEAFVRLKRSQADPSELGKAYEAVERWALDQGHTIAAAPREVYYTDFMGASPSDEVCDVAWPITIRKAR
ncbi:MAG: GyrI-like domain-containing protein [Thermomicrobiales bacterium]